jgi:hypothetical protein
VLAKVAPLLICLWEPGDMHIESSLMRARVGHRCHHGQGAEIHDSVDMSIMPLVEQNRNDLEFDGLGEELVFSRRY